LFFSRRRTLRRAHGAIGHEGQHRDRHGDSHRPTRDSRGNCRWGKGHKFAAVEHDVHTTRWGNARHTASLVRQTSSCLIREALRTGGERSVIIREDCRRPTNLFAEAAK
jgi:hypothetical protein